MCYILVIEQCPFDLMGHLSKAILFDSRDDAMSFISNPYGGETEFLHELTREFEWEQACGSMCLIETNINIKELVADDWLIEYDNWICDYSDLVYKDKYNPDNKLWRLVDVLCNAGGTIICQRNFEYSCNDESNYMLEYK